MAEHMENQMDDLIESGHHLHAQKYDELKSDIEKFINDNRYTWTFRTIVEQYKELKSGYYISHTATIIVEEFIDRMEVIIPFRQN